MRRAASPPQLLGRPGGSGPDQAVAPRPARTGIWGSRPAERCPLRAQVRIQAWRSVRFAGHRAQAMERHRVRGAERSLAGSRPGAPPGIRWFVTHRRGETGPWLGGASKRRCRRRRGRCRRLLVGWQGEPVRHHRVVRTHVGEHRGQGAAGHQVGEAEPHAPEVRLGHPLVSGGLGSEVVGCWQAGAWASSCSAWPGSPQVIGDQPGVETARVVRLASGASTVRRPACSRSSSHARRALCPYLSAAVGRYPVAWQQSAGRGLCRSPAALAARGGSRTIGSSLTSVP